MTVQSTPEHDRPAPGYYPDPSIPGFVRYWDGDGWTPGSARRAPAEGEVLAPPKNARPPRVRAQRAEETGPVFLDETGAASLWTAREHVPATPITWGVPPRTEVEGIAGLPAREAGEGWTLPSGGVAEPTDVPSTAGPSDRPRPAWLEEQTGDWPDAAVFAREAASRTTTGAGSGPSAAQAGGDLTSSAVQSSGHAAGSDRPSGQPGERATGQEPPGHAPASPPGPAGRDTHRGPWAAAHGLLPTAQPSAPPGPAAGGGLVPGERRNGPSGAGGSGGGVGRGADRAPDPSPSGCGELPFADRESSAGAAESRVGHPDASGPAVERSGDVERLRGGRTPEPSDGATAAQSDARLLPGDEAVGRHSHAPSGAWSGGGAGRGADDVPGPMGEPPFAGPEFVDGGAGSRADVRLSPGERADASPGGEAGAGGFAETGPARDERTPAPSAGGSPREAGRAPHDELPPARRGFADLLKSRPGSSGRAAPAEESGPAGQRAVGATERGARPLRGGRVPAPEGPGSAALDAATAAVGAARPARAVRAGVPAFAPAPALRRAGARAVDLALTLGTSAFLAGVPLAQRVVTHLQDKLADARLSGLPQRVWLVDPTVLGCVGALLAVVLGLGLVYEAVPTALRGRTLGKALFGLRVVDARTRSRPALGRAVARLLSTTLLLGLGRDRLARTRVVRAPRRNAARQPGR